MKLRAPANQSREFESLRARHNQTLSDTAGGGVSEDGTSDLCGGDFINPLAGGLGDGQRFPRTGGPFGYNGAFSYARLNVNF